MSNMKRLKKFLRRFCVAFKQIKLTDKCLILFMIILMTQSVHSLFIPEINAKDSGKIDVVIRTTAAGIFGYFISANFARKPHGDNFESRDYIPPPDIQDMKPGKMDGNATKNQIGYMSPEANKPEDMKRGSARENDRPKQFKPNAQQIVIVTTIGILSLIVVVIYRNNMVVSEGADSTVSQLRDFISGSVGFLLGYVDHGDKP